MRTGPVLGLSLALLLSSGASALAHHSGAMFDRIRTVTLKGTVKAFNWTNPHTWTYVLAQNDQGGTDEWAIEGGSPNNVVPDLAVLRVNMRPRTPELQAHAQARIASAVEQLDRGPDLAHGRDLGRERDFVRHLGRALQQEVVFGASCSDALEDIAAVGVRVNSSSRPGFSPAGTCTAGTLFLQSKNGTQYAIRISNVTTRTRMLRYEPALGSWVPA